MNRKHRLAKEKSTKRLVETVVISKRQQELVISMLSYLLTSYPKNSLLNGSAKFLKNTPPHTHTKNIK